MSCNAKNSASFPLLLCFLIWAMVGRASPPPSGVAPVLQPAGGLRIDGDLVANTPAAGVGDWMLSNNSGAGGAVLNAAGQSLNSTISFHFVDPYSSGSDLVFVGGMKWTDN